MARAEGVVHPTVSVLVEIEPQLNSLGVFDEPGHTAARTAVEQTLSEVLSDLGIPGTPLVSITECEVASQPRRPLRLTVNGHRCRFPDELLGSLHAYVASGRQDEVKMSAAGLASLPQDLAVEFLGMLCGAIVKLQPAVLLGAAHAEAYGASIQSAGWTRTDLEWLRGVLRPALDLRLSLADVKNVDAVLAQADGGPIERVAEDLIAALRPNFVEIHVSPDYLRQLTTGGPQPNVDVMPALRDSLFRDLGMIYPPFRWHLAPSLKPGTFCFKLNNLTTPPARGLRPDQCAVMDPPERLEHLNVEARRWWLPGSGEPVSVIGIDAKQIVESAGLKTFDAFAFLARGLRTALALHSACFVDKRVVEARLERLPTFYPVVARPARDVLPPERVTQVLRALVADLLPIRNLRVILEQLLDYSLDAQAGAVYDLDTSVAYVRKGLQAGARVALGRGLDRITVYRIDDSVETLLDAPLIHEVDQERILDAVWSTLRGNPLERTRPVLMASASVRPRLRQVLAADLPWALVISDADLPAGTFIDSLGTISLPAPSPVTLSAC